MEEYNTKATVRSVAALAGVSRMTVTRGLRNDPHVAASTRLRVQRAARKLGYRVNPLASSVMSHIRRAQVSMCRGKIAWLNCEKLRDAWTDIPWLLPRFEGARERAAQTGFLLEDFWLADPALNQDRVHAILKARGVEGLIIPDPSEYRQIERPPDCGGFACVTISTPPPELRVHEVSTDHIDAVHQSLASLRERGYARIALMLHASQVWRTQGAWQAAYLQEMVHLSPRAQIPMLMLPEEACDGAKRKLLFRDWYERYQPEAVMCDDEFVLEWARDLGLKVPSDVGLVHLERHAYLKQWAGIGVPEEEIGSAAVDLVVGQLTRGEFGLPPFPKKVIIKGQWVDGRTVRRIR